MKYNIFLFASLTVAAYTRPLLADTDNLIVHERRVVSTESSFLRKNVLNGSTPAYVRIALKQRNLNEGMDLLLAVSDPSSPSYGKHYTPEKIVELFSPSETSIGMVKAWLISLGIPASSIVLPKSKGWIAFPSTVENLENMLHAKYYSYLDRRSNMEHIGTDAYSLPGRIAEHIDFISPGVSFLQSSEAVYSNSHHSTPKARVTNQHDLSALLDTYKKNRDDLSVCGSLITPQCIKKMYRIPASDLAHPNNSMGIYEASTEIYAQSDLDRFFALASPNIPNGTHPIADLIGNVTASGQPAPYAEEANLDYDMAYPIVYPQTIVDYQVETTGYKFFDSFLDAIDGTFCADPTDGTTTRSSTITGHSNCGKFTPTNVISISYGLTEGVYSVKYIEYMKLGLQGTSVFVSSGDLGVAQDGCLGPKETLFSPDTPATCPYVTAVGATVLPKGSKVGDEEEATSSFASGGGFSNIFSRPNYQNHALNRYFLSHDPGFKNYTLNNTAIPKEGDGIYNGAGRGFPDIAAVGDRGLVVFRGKAGLVAGTSMSTPIIAAMFNLINERRLQMGKKPVGFVNPTLYAHSEMFNDVTKGSQLIADESGSCGGKAFSAVRGWDPVTGLGTPRFDKMLEVFTSLP